MPRARRLFERAGFEVFPSDKTLRAAVGKMLEGVGLTAVFLVLNVFENSRKPKRCRTPFGMELPDVSGERSGFFGGGGLTRNNVKPYPPRLSSAQAAGG